MHKTNKLIIFISLLFISIPIFNVRAAIVFNKLDSPYLIDNDFVVDAGDTLIMEAGVQVILNENANILVFGVLLINGKEEDPVFLLPATDSIGWGIIDIDSPDSECRLENVHITDGRIVTHGVNLFMQNVYFFNRQDLVWNDAITRVFEGSVVIIGCRIAGSGVGEGFLIHNQSNPIISQCSFENIPDAIELINIDNGVIRRNVFSNLPDDAIDLNNCSNILIDSNVIINAEDRGIEIGSENFGSSDNIMVNRNLIIGCNEGVIFKENSFGHLQNNTFYKNNIAVSCIESQKNKEGSSVEILNSVFSQSVDADFYFDDASTINVDYSLSDLLLPAGTSNLIDDPLFVNPEENGFLLLDNSPCINAGDPQSPYDPDNTISDLGAFFYNTDTTFIIDDEQFYVNVYPNPFCDKFYVTYQLQSRNRINITLFEINGAIVKTVLNKYQEPGYHKIMIDNTGLSTIGAIVCKIIIGDKSKELVLIKHL